MSWCISLNVETISSQVSLASQITCTMLGMSNMLSQRHRALLNAKVVNVGIVLQLQESENGQGIGDHDSPDRWRDRS